MQKELLLMVDLEKMIEKGMIEKSAVSILNKILYINNFSKSGEYRALFNLGQYLRTAPSNLGQDKYEKMFNNYYESLSSYISKNLRVNDLNQSNEAGSLVSFLPKCAEESALSFTASISVEKGKIFFDAYMEPDKIVIKRIWGNMNGNQIVEEIKDEITLENLKESIRKKYSKLN